MAPSAGVVNTTLGGVLSATVLVCFASTLLMGLYAKLPYALAPEMGINALVTYTVILGSKPVVLDAKLSERVGGHAGEEWLRVDSIRWTEPGGRPLCFIQSYVPKRFEAVIPEFAGHQGPFFDFLERYSREIIKEAQQEIRSEAMPPEIAASLGLPAESRSLQILRRYITDSGVLIASFNWHPADQMTYKMRIRRGRQQA